MMPLPPLFGQEKDDTCALACLRMILAQHGTHIPEATLAQRANKPQGGVDIEDLRDLAASSGLAAVISRLDIVAIADLLAHDVFPIVYLNRAHFDRKRCLPRSAALRTAIVHAVVPIRVSPHFITVHDPLPGMQRRVSRRTFEAAQSDLGYWCIVCSSSGSPPM
jgi:ABC-type bacteriocin/lantibiotic exporter with double-glycine peptidase domain